MSIKSKKWYENQIKALENATNKLHREGESLSYSYGNDIAGFSRAAKPIINKSDKLLHELRVLREEYYLYYR